MGCACGETGCKYPDVGSRDCGNIAVSCGGIAISCRWHSDTGMCDACARANLADGVECQFCPRLTNFGARTLPDRWGYASCSALAQCRGMDLCCRFLDDAPQHGALVGNSAPMIEVKICEP